MWIQTGVSVPKWLNGVLTAVTLTFDPWPCPFVRTSFLLMVITPANFMMIQWWEHSEKGVTDRQTDGRADRRTEPFHRAAWSQLKKRNQLNHHFKSIFHPELQWFPIMDRAYSSKLSLMHNQILIYGAQPNSNAFWYYKVHVFHRQHMIQICSNFMSCLRLNVHVINFNTSHDSWQTTKTVL